MVPITRQYNDWLNKIEKYLMLYSSSCALKSLKLSFSVLELKNLRETVTDNHNLTLMQFQPDLHGGYTLTVCSLCVHPVIKNILNFRSSAIITN